MKLLILTLCRLGGLHIGRQVAAARLRIAFNGTESGRQARTTMPPNPFATPCLSSDSLRAASRDLAGSAQAFLRHCFESRAAEGALLRQEL